MPKVLVHGNPETSALWGTLVEALATRGIDDIVLLSPPGFGAPIPDGFEATQDGYRDWLIGELDALAGPIDLVGHDWGAGHVFGILAERPDLVHTWAADCIGLLHPDYVWHDAAQMWQTPEVGEEAVAAMFGGSADDRATGWAKLGIRADVAAAIAEAQDATMGRCVLDLYRSAAQPAMADLGRRLRAAALPPGLVIVPTDDPYAGDATMVSETITALGADRFTLEGLGHWWMFDGADGQQTPWSPIGPAEVGQVSLGQWGHWGQTPVSHIAHGASSGWPGVAGTMAAPDRSAWCEHCVSIALHRDDEFRLPCTEMTIRAELAVRP